MRDIEVQFLFDFGSPNAYLCHKVIGGIEARQQVRFEYVPILLGGLFKLSGNRSPGEAFAGVENKQKFMMLEMRRFIERYGLTAYRHNPHFPVNTLQIMRGAIAAQRNGTFERYVDRMFAHMWEEGLKMDDPAVIRAALEADGLDAMAFETSIQDAEVKAALLANTQSAFERGAFGSPTFFVGEQMYFGKDQLRDVEEEIARVKARA
ncbi:2-hydroxychromene-2-carboxylate isomerase [Paraburkholderia silvatlantica]|uniref:2-hydroxychromene-2-carboxylate isomerase n=1 Tax=Paraburkholderia silvatlantica TaxID=321895 RepID=A0A2V4TDM8_9BURK|nr:2-hydroxychromene-2-carboxylate isomerase [Paraburkholderia silvatlantica]PYE21891.1 2-hydroxychromene-2-carboxylate isomerase [Paraburkholderia silvatlantica]TDQ99300.1 2-hydroxychromene-2-carboxylate isomerase [Paraburkholderia silvatlantica]